MLKSPQDIDVKQMHLINKLGRTANAGNTTNTPSIPK